MKSAFKITVFLIVSLILVSWNANPISGGEENVYLTDSLTEIDSLVDLYLSEVVDTLLGTDTVAETTYSSYDEDKLRIYCESVDRADLQYYAGMEYLNKGDTAKALKLFKTAALIEELEDFDGYCQEGARRFVVKYYYELGNFDKALLWCKKYLGLYGESYKESDVYYLLALFIYPDAGYLGYLQKAADMGDAEAMATMACLYAMGCDVKRDDKKAIALYRKYLKNTDDSEQKVNKRKKVNIGDVYCHLYKGSYFFYVLGDLGIIEGLYERRDKGQWLQKAVELGNDEAQFLMGEKYEYQDKEQAIKWYRKAARQGHKGAQQKLKDMGKTWKKHGRRKR